MNDPDEFDVEAARLMSYCDQCGPSTTARMVATIGDGILKFCNHCSTVNRAGLNARNGFLYTLEAV